MDDKNVIHGKIIEEEISGTVINDSLESIPLTPAEVKKLSSKGFERIQDVQQFFPRKYYDFSHTSSLTPNLNGKYIAVIGKFDKIEIDKKGTVLMLKAKVLTKPDDKKLNVMWIGSFYLKDIIRNWVGEDVIVCGKMTYFEEYHSFHMNNPLVFSTYIDMHKKIMPIYKKMSGISEEWMLNIIKKALKKEIISETPQKYVSKHNLVDIETAYNSMHFPESIEALKKAQTRLVYDELLSFAWDIEKEQRNVSKGTRYNIKSIEKTKSYAAGLSFDLTESQKKTFNSIYRMASGGLRVNALVQGDVGSGKTMIAFLSMIAIAESGYQSVLMAPTEVLAGQHYEKFKEDAETMGFGIEYLRGGMKAKEKKEALKRILLGESKIIIGTHSVLSDAVEYNDLALIVIDEEHKFGVAQEERLLRKASEGVHVINMSATPIPRTIAQTVYGDSVQVYDLELPGRRKEIKTVIMDDQMEIYDFIDRQLGEGSQAYVVCPVIEKSTKKKAMNVIDVFDAYIKRYEMARPGTVIKSVTGKTSSEETEEILKAFHEGKVDILVSTTVIEVGVDNPNATVIVINSAENFGLAQLHQLRGRVGRGSKQGYCILNSQEKDNERLKAIRETTNGYKLAEKDLLLRGPGDILGERQSGTNKQISLAIKYPKIYAAAKDDARELMNVGGL